MRSKFTASNLGRYTHRIEGSGMRCFIVPSYIVLRINDVQYHQVYIEGGQVEIVRDDKLVKIKDTPVAASA